MGLREVQMAVYCQDDDDYVHHVVAVFDPSWWDEVKSDNELVADCMEELAETLIERVGPCGEWRGATYLLDWFDGPATRWLT